MSLLADELYLVMHEDNTGKPRLHPRATGLGLAAGLIGELLLSQHLKLASGSVVILDRRPPEDALAHTTLDHILAEPQHNVRVWLQFFAQTGAESVATRLTRVGKLVPESSRWRKGVTYVPTDMSAAAWPETRLRLQLARKRPWTVEDALLGGLASAAGLGARLLRDAPETARRDLTYIVGELPSPMYELIAHTEAAIGDAVLSYRN